MIKHIFSCDGFAYYAQKIVIVLGLLLLWSSMTLSDARAQDVTLHKKIALSFDDIPRHEGMFLSRTERRKILIKALKRGGIEQAVFFLNPARIDSDEFKEIHLANIAAYANAGHVLANHTADHVRLSDVSAEEFLDDIDAAEVWLKPYAAYRPWMRHPYLDEGKDYKVKRAKVRAGLKQRSLINAYVTVDSSDWLIDNLANETAKTGKKLDMKALGDLFVESHVQSANFAHDLARRTLGRDPVQMMLLHETDITAMFTEDLVRALQADGWQIVSADEAYADPLVQMVSDADYVGGTLLEVLASDKGIAAPRWYERNAPAIMKQLFNERVLREGLKKK